MSPDELRQWRVSRNLSHQETADLLGASSRFVVIRWEKGAELPSTIVARIAEAEAIIAATPPGEKPAAHIKKKSRSDQFDYGKHQCWDLAGNEITMQHVLARPCGYHFYRLDNSAKDIDDETGHQIANLWETTRAYPTGQCTFLQLDVQTWEPRVVAWKDNPAHIKALETCQRLIAHKQAL